MTPVSSPTVASPAPSAPAGSGTGNTKFAAAAAVAAELQAQLAQTVQDVMAGDGGIEAMTAPDLLKLDFQTQALSLHTELLASIVRADKDILQSITRQI